MSEKHVALYYKEGTSDKEYHVHLTKKAGGYVVSIEYGRRGSSLTTSNKTPSPVDLDTAVSIFEKQVHSKRLKGYTEEAGHVPYVGSDKEEKITGVLPQLLNNIEKEELNDYFGDPEFWMQEKKDGKRILVRSTHGTIEAINRKGLLVGFPATIAGALSQLAPDFLFDGEMIGETIWLFDALEYNGTDLRKYSYEDRYTTLESVVQYLNDEGSCIRLVETAKNEKEKRASFKKLKKQGVEGVVFKRSTAVHKPGRPASRGDQLKFKFKAQVTCQVSALNEKGKRSVYVQCLSENILVDVGKVTILPNFGIPKVGALVEIEYLYRHVHGALYQPVYLGERDDKDTPDQVSTLKVKEGIEIDEEDS